MHILQTIYANPIEREFEAWIVNCIEEYFKKINKQIRIFAVSPALETTFPADEVLSFDFKIIGLQFKKTSVSALRAGQITYNYANIHWVLNNPPGQFALVQSMKEIFYCLPTFVNRYYKDVALEHCLLWRPKAGMKAGTYWYNNSNAHRRDNRNIEPTSLRWGQFIERLYECSIGDIQTAQRVTQELLAKTILKSVNLEGTEGLYVLIIEL